MKTNLKFFVICFLLSLFLTNPNEDELTYRFSKRVWEWMKDDSEIQQSLINSSVAHQRRVRDKWIFLTIRKFEKAKKFNRLKVYNCLFFTYITLKDTDKSRFYYLTFLNLEITNLETSLLEYNL